MAIRVVIADGHPIVLKGMEALLAAEPDFQIVASCTDGEQALRAVRAHQPDILVLDLHMPVKNGIEVLRDIRASGTRTRPILLVAAIRDEELIEATRQNLAGLMCG